MYTEKNTVKRGIAAFVVSVFIFIQAPAQLLASGFELRDPYSDGAKDRIESEFNSPGLNQLSQGIQRMLDSGEFDLDEKVARERFMKTLGTSVESFQEVAAARLNALSDAEIDSRLQSLKEEALSNGNESLVLQIEEFASTNAVTKRELLHQVTQDLGKAEMMAKVEQMVDQTGGVVNFLEATQAEVNQKAHVLFLVLVVLLVADFASGGDLFVWIGIGYIWGSIGHGHGRHPVRRGPVRRGPVRRAPPPVRRR